MRSALLVCLAYVVLSLRLPLADLHLLIGFQPHRGEPMEFELAQLPVPAIATGNLAWTGGSIRVRFAMTVREPGRRVQP